MGFLSVLITFNPNKAELLIVVFSGENPNKAGLVVVVFVFAGGSQFDSPILHISRRTNLVLV